MSTEPREFWIKESHVKESKGFDFFFCEVCKRQPNPAISEEADFFHHIHVIEYSAYQALEQKLAVALNRLNALIERHR